MYGGVVTATDDTLTITTESMQVGTYLAKYIVVY